MKGEHDPQGHRARPFPQYERDDQRIKELYIETYSETPTKYLVIFDRECLLLGSYYPDRMKLAGTNYLPPHVIRSQTMAKSYVDWFEITRKHWANENRSQPIASSKPEPPLNHDAEPSC